MANYASLARTGRDESRVPADRRRHERGGLAQGAARRDTASRATGRCWRCRSTDRIPATRSSCAAGRKLSFRAAMRSLAPLDHVEVLYNGRVVARHGKKDATQAELSGAIPVTRERLDRAARLERRADPLIFDLYPYASTSPIYVERRRAADEFARGCRVLPALDRPDHRVGRRRDDYNDARKAGHDGLPARGAGRLHSKSRSEGAATVSQPA